MSLEQADALLVANEIRTRYDPLRAVTLIARAIVRALFGGRTDDVIFWALVHAHYRGIAVSDRLERQLAALLGRTSSEPSESH